MLTHYLTVAALNFRRAPLATSVNVLTLSLGLVCFVTAYAVVGFWDRAEQYFPNADRTLVVTSQYRLRDGGAIDSGVLPLTNHWLAQYLRADFPQIEAVARVLLLDETAPVRAGERAVRLRTFAADAQFLEIFDLPFRAGDSRTALREPRSVILTVDAARRLYGEGTALGRPIAIGNQWDGTVTGVIDAIPEPSHMGRSAAAPLRFDMLVSRDFYESALRSRRGADTTQEPENWINVTPNTTYVLLPADGSLTADGLRRQLPEFITRHVPQLQRDRFNVRFDVMPVDDLLGTAVGGSLFVQQSGVSVSAILLLLGALVLGVACVDFANLATARAVARTREVGVRKAVGAKAQQVAGQYLLEAGLLTIAALVIALSLIGLLISVLDRATGIDLGVSLFRDFGSWASLLGLVVVVTVVAGGYPAFVLSEVRPVSALRAAQLRTGPRFLATLLVGIQFSVAAFLLIAVAVVYLQNQELERTGLGIAAAPLLVVENDESVTGLTHDTLREELLHLPQVISATAVVVPPWMNSDAVLPLTSSPAVSAIERTAIPYVVGYDFFETFDIELLAGRVFDPQRADDVLPPGAAEGQTRYVVIARELAEQLGFASPETAIDKLVYTPGDEGRRWSYHIIGVVEDEPLHISSSLGPRPSAYLFVPALNFHVVRLSANDISGALEAIDALWQRLVPAVALNRRFVDEYFNDSYTNFARINLAFTGLALIALLISTVGLFAMAQLVANRRVGEIGVRKTLGATNSQMVLMLLGSFAKPVLIANIIAWPLAYMAARAYLAVFISPIALTVVPFVGCLAVTLLIAWIAVVGQTLRAANTEPAEVLRHE